MANNERDTVVGVFLDEQHAQRAIQLLKQAGFNADISQGQDLQGLSQDQMRVFQSRAGEGNVLVSVNDPSDRGEEATNLMLESGAENIEMQRTSDGSLSGQNVQSGMAAGSQTDYSKYEKMHANERQYGHIDQTTGRGRTADQQRIQLREETLSANKQSVEAGQVELHKVVHEKEQQIPVNLSHEEVVIHREAVDRPLQGGEIGDMKDEVIRVPVYEEQAQLQKQARVREEVSIDKEVVQQQQTLSGTAKHEHLEVQESGNVQVKGDGGTNTNVRNETTYGDETKGDQR